MNETEERTGLEPRSGYQTTSACEEEEPPGKPRRHPLWRDVPDHQWNDWRWQRPLELRRVVVRDLSKERPEALPRELLTSDLRAVLDDPHIDVAVELVGGVDCALRAVTVYHYS